MVFSSLEMQRRIIETKVYDQFFFTLSEKKTLTNIKKLKLQATFSPVCILLV